MLTRLRYESRINRCVARLAVLPDEPCTRGHMTSAAVLHIESNEPNRRPFASKRNESRVGERVRRTGRYQSRQHAISHATCCSHCAVLPRSPWRATATLHCKAATLPFMCLLAPPAPTSKLLVHSLALLRLSALSVRWFTGCPVHRTRDKEWDTSVSRNLQ